MAGSTSPNSHETSPQRLNLTPCQSSSRRIDELCLAVFDTLDDFNTTPPYSVFSLETLALKHLLVAGRLSAFSSQLAGQTRNHLTFSDGGLQVGVSDQIRDSSSLASACSSKYEEKMQAQVAYNIESGWGGV